MKILLSIFAIFLVYSSSFEAFAVDTNVQNAYSQFVNKLEQKYSKDMQKNILKVLNARLETLSENTNKASIVGLVDQFQVLNNEKLYDLWLNGELSSASQKIQELRDISEFKSQLPERVLPEYIDGLISPNLEYIHTDDSREFYDGKDIQRILYSSYIPISSGNVSQIQNKSGIIIYDSSSGYRYVEEYSYERKIPYSELSESFSAFLTENHRVVEKNGSFYGYNFLNFRYFEDTYGTYMSSLESSGFDFSQTLLYRRADGGYNFVTDYSEYKIADSDILFGVPEKHLFLDYLREDSKFESTNMSTQLREIQKLSQSLTIGKTREESISAIYSWILNNVEYTRIIDLSDEKIFSGVETFINGDGVCTGYTKLSSYLFYFAGYHDIEVIRGHVIDAQDFPEIGHAWLKIGDLYYDPTFDDPIGAQNTKEPSEYMYFGLPKDIFYANRYEYDNLPEFLNTATESEIRQHIFTKLTKLIPKYQNKLSDYPVFGEVVFRNTYNITVSTPITPKVLSQTIGSYSVENNSFRYTDESGAQRQILGVRYYPLTPENTTSVLDLFGFDTDSLTLFNWQKESGEYEWRLAYELETR